MILAVCVYFQNNLFSLNLIFHDYMTKILIVEDSKTQGLLLKSTLEDAGFEVVCAEDGRSGLEFARRHTPDLIITDIRMPDINGYELAWEIKNDFVLKRIPVILLSHLAETKDIIMGLESLADSYVIKPFNEEELLTNINFLLTNPNEECQNPLSVVLDNEVHPIRSNRRQILCFLVSTYETMISRNRQLLEVQTKLRLLNDQLEQRTKQLEESEIRFRSLVETVPDIIYRIDEEGYIVFINQSIRKLGYEPKDLVGKHFSEIIAPHQVDQVSRKTALASIVDNQNYTEPQPKLFDERRAGERKTTGLEILLKVNQSDNVVSGIVDALENDYVDMEVSSIGMYQLSEDNNIFIGSVGVIRDISDRKLAEKYLKTAKQQAEKANKAKSDFLSSMSHELRTPLNAILGFSQLLRTDDDNPLSADHADSLREIHHAGEHLLDLVNEILDLAAIESGKSSLELEVVSPADFLPHCQNMVRILAKKYQVDFNYEVTFPYENYHVRVDLTRIKQVLLNLLSNAVKYNRKEGTATLKCENFNDEYIRISVIDTGIGIAKEDLDNIFEPFSRAEKSKHVEGTGIGLAITKQLVDAMGGKISVSSEFDKGSVFWIDLELVSKD
ncbi:MAG: response regulator [Methylococcaceae bacterium]|nr:response regulator [Methylococcaceae bacterium]